MNMKQRKQVQKVFIESLLRDSNVSLACEVAGINRTTAYQWRKDDEDFCEQWDNVIERTRDVARQSIYARGIVGWDEPVISMGQAVYEYEPVLDENGEQTFDKKGKPVTLRSKMMVHKWSDSLAALYAKANLPEYKEKQQIDLNAQIITIAETAKAELLADLAATMTDEDKDPVNQQEP
jgi:hypothetical protein